MLDMTSREQQVLALIRIDPMTPQQAIAERLGISRSAVAGHIMNLTQKGLIKGRGYVLSDAPFVTVIGGANIDIHGKSSKALRSKDSNPGSVHIAAGGVGRNIAENLARLGVDSRLISVVGNDHHGQMLLRLSRDAGINVQNVHEIPSATTSTYLSVIDDSGDMLVGINDMSIIDQLTVALLQPHKAMLKQSSLVVVDSNLHPDTLAWISNTVTDTPIFADTVSTAKALRLKPHLQNIHTLKTGTIEVEALTGLEARTQKQLRQVADQLHGHGVERVFITRGGKGVFYSDNENQDLQKMPRSNRNIHNAGGAGDAFLAGLAYAWLENWPLEKSVQFSLAAADITLSHPGTSSPALSLGRVQQAMEMQSA
jgi:pseudouridine kinase